MSEVWIVEHLSGPVHGVKSVHRNLDTAKASIPGTWSPGNGDASQEWFITVAGTQYNSPYRLFRMSVQE